MENFERLERLLLNKSYQELTPAEVDWIASQDVDQEAFNQQREVLRSMKDNLSRKSPLVPSSDVFRNALAFQHKSRLRSRRKVWLVGAAMITIGCFIGRWSATVQETIVKKEIQEPSASEVIRDTVFVNQIREIESAPKVIYRERIQKDTVYIPMAIANNATAEELARDVLSVTTLKDLPELSRNARETEALLKVLVEVY
ncbi:hypothetical protein [Lewinella cohaerens]|uniref:hypothetical protein n=1 Tax=Lewinella cohaerens TaxID=70995 RepID=UPI00036C5768|nr:hypothetical protein [Lewinella cohaerens]